MGFGDDFSKNCVFFNSSKNLEVASWWKISFNKEIFLDETIHTICPYRAIKEWGLSSSVLTCEQGKFIPTMPNRQAWMNCRNQLFAELMCEWDWSDLSNYCQAARLLDKYKMRLDSKCAATIVCPLFKSQAMIWIFIPRILLFERMS